MTKQKAVRVLAVLTLVVVTTAIAIFACVWVAEHYFFDKFFYQKSEAHGYWIAEETSYKGLASYGSRGEDILALLDFIEEDKDPQTLKASAANEFTVAILGDSYTWGVGVREQQRYADLVEQKLNQYRPTKVLVLAMEGDNIVDHYRKYAELLKSGTQVDLFIFGVVHNDAFLKKYPWYGKEAEDEIYGCEGEVVWDVSEDWAEIDVAVEYPKRVVKSLQPGTKNYCIVQTLIPKLPKHQALYVNLDSLLTTNPDSMLMAEEYQKAGYPVLTMQTIAPDHTPKQQRLFVSQKETHPSVLAHELYANSIVETLLDDPRFGFIER